MKKLIFLLNISYLLATMSVMGQESIKLAIEDFQISPILAETLSSADLSSRFREIAIQYSAKYEIVPSVGTIEAILQRLKIECRLGACPDPNQYPELRSVKADKILKAQVSFSDRRLRLSARLLNKKSFSQERTFHKKMTSRIVTDEALCLFWQQIEPDVSFNIGICVPKVWACDERRGETCPIQLAGYSVCTMPSKLSDTIAFKMGNCSVNVFTQGPLGEFILKPQNRIAELTVKSLMKNKACITLNDRPSRNSIRVKIMCDKRGFP
ncbi:MAG: hypothetical protein VSS75_005810 [Candidatus Parabeggiatoa sp.]|nr:hypothetical protein [Candidatus Parabeggiatoa sp.]